MEGQDPMDNYVGSDIETLMANLGIDMAALTVLDGILGLDPSISSASAFNITVRKKSKGGSSNFRGRSKTKSLFHEYLSDFREITITVIDDVQALRAGRPQKSLK